MSLSQGEHEVAESMEIKSSRELKTVGGVGAQPQGMFQHSEEERQEEH